ncbi:MAG TPA: hypothetical protein VI837_08865 [Blastocatellia bacterium]|nr:hypothetical protein [Blastocatellia bacterium]
MRTSEIPYTKDKLSYAGYSITVERKRVKVEEYNAENEVAVLKKNGRTIRAFDAVRHPLGAFTRIALAPVLGDGYLQLVVEQTGPRSWAYWVTALKPHFRIVFTNDYPVDHELRVEDRDGDGIPELLMTLNTFWFFDGLCGACSPRFDIAFKYDKKRGDFRPANHILKALCDTDGRLAEAEQTIKLWQSGNPDIISNPVRASELYSRVLIHALPLLYCGKESLGWSFFDRLYNLPDREVRKSRIKRTLRRDRVYRAIQNDLKRTRREASLHRARLSE